MASFLGKGGHMTKYTQNWFLKLIALISGVGCHMTNCNSDTSYQISAYSRYKWSHSKLEAKRNKGWLFKWPITGGHWEIQTNFIYEEWDICTQSELV